VRRGLLVLLAAIDSARDLMACSRHSSIELPLPRVRSGRASTQAPQTSVDWEIIDRRPEGSSIMGT
jgi:hypothetical protein